MLATIYQPNKKNLYILFIAAFLVRASTFLLYVQHEGRYQQPDSMDYHNCALGIIYGTGMHRADNLIPIFWRTPGYPVYLAAFYKLLGGQSTAFNGYTSAQKIAIWGQIVICSFEPLLIFFLALVLTQTALIAWLAAWISVFHLGLILASMYILTEGLGVFLFLIFLIFFYKNFGATKSWISYSIYAALSLGIFTWMRPMGAFVAVVTSLLILTFDTQTFTARIKKIGLFFLLFCAILAPWYIRNHNLTGQWFFCPMSGPYLNSFCAPKIVRTVKQMPLEQCIRLLYSIANQKAQEAAQALEGTGYVLARETICNSIAWPIIQEYPWIFITDWIREVIKTTFDLYASQLVAFANNGFRYDPLEEFLSEKLAACLYTQPMHGFMRSMVYLELIYALLLWIGLFGGAFVFGIYALKKRSSLWHTELLWLRVAPLILAVLAMTGGFGYARLRLPVEPLMIILSLTFWYWLVLKKKDTL